MNVRVSGWNVPVYLSTCSLTIQRNKHSHSKNQVWKIVCIVRHENPLLSWLHIAIFKFWSKHLRVELRTPASAWVGACIQKESAMEHSESLHCWTRLRLLIWVSHCNHCYQGSKLKLCMGPTIYLGHGKYSTVAVRFQKTLTDFMLCFNKS